MKILVVDDTATNLRSAQITLAGHELTLVGGEREARGILGNASFSKKEPPFDAVLLDLLMPHSHPKPDPTDPLLMRFPDSYEPELKRWNDYTASVGQLFVAGYALALLAVRSGVKYVAVATMGNHHEHPAMEQQDFLGGNVFNIDGSSATFGMAPTIMIETPNGLVEAKDWGKVLAELLGNG